MNAPPSAAPASAPSSSPRSSEHSPPQADPGSAGAGAGSRLDGGSDDRILHTAGVLILAWLALPNLIFLAGWLRPSYAWPAAIGLALALAWSARGRIVLPRPRTALLIALACAVPWVVLSGIGHLVYANQDWLVRDAVLLDLVLRPWPVVYHGVPEQGDLLLRAPIGLYLPAAAAGKLAGMGLAGVVFFFWCLAGVVLALWLVARRGATPRAMLVRVLVFVFFSGMDGMGTLMRGDMPTLGSHIEWWARVFQYSSHTTQLFWVPNHALPGWLAIGWLLGTRVERLPIAMSVALLACVPLYSPLTALGIAPFFIVAIMRRLGVAHWNWRLLILPDALLITGITCALIFPYLLLSAQVMPFDSALAAFPQAGPWRHAVRYVEFVLLEFLILGVLLLLHFRREPMLITALVVLLLLPLVHFGPYNDLVMRTSIPALAVLALRLGDWFGPLWTGGADAPEAALKAVSKDAPGQGGEDPRASLAMLVFAVGVFTPLLELSRPFVFPVWDFDLNSNVIRATGGVAPHYLAPAHHAWAVEYLGTPP